VWESKGSSSNKKGQSTKWKWRGVEYEEEWNAQDTRFAEQARRHWASKVRAEAQKKTRGAGPSRRVKHFLLEWLAMIKKGTGLEQALSLDGSTRQTVNTGAEALM